ncbi:MAG: amidase [Rhodothermales bacterium]
MDRRAFVEACSAAGLGSLWPGVLYAKATEATTLTTTVIAEAEKLMGLTFTEEQRELMLEDLQDRLATYERLRAKPIPNAVVPALRFDPMIGQPALAEAKIHRIMDWSAPSIERPASDEDLAFLPVTALATLIRDRKVTATELTEVYLQRLKQYAPVLQAVVTLTEERARKQAAEADLEIAAGRYRGPLHGIPWGAKDLLSVKGYPTTWGATPYREQVIDEDAEVVKRLDAAGAILVAKLTLGALAWGDVWFGGTTKNPWNTEQGSSGSSAGPGSAVAAGLVGFAIGSETLGSIVSPSTRNGVTGHRPTFGRVSRAGAMALSWSMDKLGPMCRSAADCALVFDAIHGYDAGDPTTTSQSFAYPLPDIRDLRIGYYASAFEGDYNGHEHDQAVLDVLRGQGLTLTPVELPQDDRLGAMLLTLNAEAAAAFDDLTRSGGTDTMVRQIRNAWPNVFRHARFIPAVEYLQANRARTELMEAMHAVLETVDVIVTPSFRGGALQITNLTGHPCVVMPHAFVPLDGQPDSPRRSPRSISFIGGLHQDDAVLAVANTYQRATDFHRQRPPIH